MITWSESARNGSRGKYGNIDRRELEVEEDGATENGAINVLQNKPLCLTHEVKKKKLNLVIGSISG